MHHSRAMLLESPGAALVPGTIELRNPGAHEVLIRVRACAVCRTDLHIIDGELPPRMLPLVPGHEIVGTVVAAGERVPRGRVGERVGVPWLGWTCRECEYCLSGRENLCPRARLTGYDIHGGYAEHVLSDARYCHALPEGIDDASAAPLLCAGLIGYRAYRAAGDAPHLGLFGFGAAAHLIAQVAMAEGRRVHAFTRPGDAEGQAFARALGAVWAGGSDQLPPQQLHAAIIFAPVGALIPAALRATRPGGTVVCAGIHMSDIPSFPYEILWQERVLRSVANLTRDDGARFMELVSRTPIRSETRVYALDAANAALSDLRHGRLRGAAVLMP